jgi:alpha-tubulin suppressor-like RCC1 family protein
MNNKYIACRVTHSVAIKNDGTIVCWGHNEFYECDPIYKIFTEVVIVSCGKIIDLINVIQFIKHLLIL